MYTFTPLPGDFVTNVTQINSQSDLISMPRFVGPVYLTIRSSFYTILIEILVFSIFTISAKLDPVMYVGILTSVHFISMNK